MRLVLWDKCEVIQIYSLRKRSMGMPILYSLSKFPPPFYSITRVESNEKKWWQNLTPPRFLNFFSVRARVPAVTNVQIFDCLGRVSDSPGNNEFAPSVIGSAEQRIWPRPRERNSTHEPTRCVRHRLSHLFFLFLFEQRVCIKVLGRQGNCGLLWFLPE